MSYMSCMVQFFLINHTRHTGHLSCFLLCLICSCMVHFLLITNHTWHTRHLSCSLVCLICLVWFNLFFTNHTWHDSLTSSSILPIFAGISKRFAVAGALIFYYSLSDIGSSLADRGSRSDSIRRPGNTQTFRLAVIW